MQEPLTEPLFQMKACSFSELDGLLEIIPSDMPDGYVTAVDENSARYLFVIEGKPYCGAVQDPTGKRTTNVKDFFTHYKSAGSADIELFKTDKKLLLCKLVRFAHEPDQTFTTDMVNLEEVVKKLADQEKDIVMCLSSDPDTDTKRGFAIFIKGKAAFVSLPEEEDPDRPPLDRLLIYPYTAGQDKTITVEMYENPKVEPAPDAAPFPAEGIATYYTKGTVEKEISSEETVEEAALEEIEEIAPEEIAEDAGAYIELIEEGTVTVSLPVAGELKIGRDPDNDIQLEEAGISRHHAVVRAVEGKIIIEDLKSTIGTFFKGIRIEKKELSHNDEINIKDFTLRLDWPAGAKKEAEAVEKLVKEPEEPMAVEEPPGEEAPDLAAQTIYNEGSLDDMEKKLPLPPLATLLLDDTEFPLGSITAIGKDEEDDIKVVGMRIARRHAVIIRGKDFFKLIRKSMLSPVKVNGEKVKEHVLRNGDIIEVGNQRMTFRVGEKR
jgi:pSer/pThr/pTyr-binding forkhead associated (FHA) protein